MTHPMGFQPMKKILLALLAGTLLAGNVFAQGQNVSNDEPTRGNAANDDPYAWLEDVTGARQLAWVAQQNQRTEAELAATPRFRQTESDIRTMLDSDAKIPGVEKIGEYYYNFWKDAAHERGIWRRTTLDEYRKPEPQWEIVLDLDALNQQEGENWVWHGADCLRPQDGQPYKRCLIALSRGGSDADVTREFDLQTKSFVQDGFHRDEAKGGLGWIDENHVYAYTDFGADSMTSSGYPRIVKQWTRGTPLSSATTVYAGKPDDMYIMAYHEDAPGFERDIVSRTLAFYNYELYLRGKDGALQKLDLPNSAEKGLHRQWLTVELREPWEVGGKHYAEGSLLAIDFDAFLAGSRDFDVLFTPTDTTSLAGVAYTRDHIVLNLLDDVKSRLDVLSHDAGGWKHAAFVGAPQFGSISIGAVDRNDSDALWMSVTDYLTPATLSLAEIGKQPEALKSNPAFFDASNEVVEQHFATSKDGTKVPYFLVRPKNLKYDGAAPTLLYGYGGFEISLTPGYSGGVGKAWLEQGGVYVVANIRGGGEYGPRWHQAAMKQNRHKAYEDFAAVAEDLIANKITSPRRLGIQGGSNGGLLMGNMLVQYPQLFGAIVCQVPLLDMKRYSHLLAGASWMAEYGNPDTSDWEFIKTFSPYQLFDPSRKYPPTLFMTSTRDDRVHPAHARKMYAKMLAAGKDVRYYENVEGGHGGAANNAQVAHMNALAYAFLWQQLGGK